MSQWKWFQLQVLSTEKVSSRFDSHSKEEASTLEVAGEEGKRVGRTEGQDLQQLQAHGTAREGVES
jgi:hypothetical protein